MKNITTIIFLFFITNLIHAQCSIEEHSNNPNDAWLSCEINENPNPDRPDSHWVLYDLGYVYSIGATKFWNYNVAGETGKGMKNITIDYSINGAAWEIAASFQLNEAPGNNNYTGEAGPNLNEVDARYILISASDTWGGGNCAGLSEVKFEIDGTVTTAAQDLFVDETSITLYPNPTAGYFTIDGTLNNFDVKILDVNGTVHQNLTNVSPQIIIDVSTLPAGLYFIEVSHQQNALLIFKKIIKQ